MPSEIDTTLINRAFASVGNHALNLEGIANNPGDLSPGQVEHLHRAAGYLRDAQYRLGLVLGIPESPDTNP